MKSRRLKGRPLLAGLALVLFLAVVGWRASIPAQVRLSGQGRVSIQQKERDPVALPATRSSLLAGKINALDPRLRGPSVPLGLLALGLFAITPALARAQRTRLKRTARLRLLQSLTLRGPPRHELA
jgi:hypothetical protein